MPWVLETTTDDPNKIGPNITIYHDLNDVDGKIGDLNQYTGVALYQISDEVANKIKKHPHLFGQLSILPKEIL